MKPFLMDQERDQSPDDSLPKEKTKTRSACLIVKKWDKVKRVVEFDQNWTITDRTTRNKVTNWQGAIAKTKVPLCMSEKWSQLPKKKKDDLWDIFQVSILFLLLDVFIVVALYVCVIII